MERPFHTILALKERGLLPDAVLRALVRLMCAQWVKTFECGGDTGKQAFYKKKYFEKLRASAEYGRLRANVSCPSAWR